MTNKQIKSGFIAIIGRPNVGKSTLINQFVGQKIAIMSPKPQTTRHRIIGVKTTEDYQMIFVDTPGIHEAKDLLNKRIDQVAVSSMFDVDLILWVVDRKKNKNEDRIIDQLKKANKPVLLIVNKIDQLKSKDAIDRIILSYINEYEFDGVYPISALNEIHLDHLEEAIVPYLADGPLFYPEEMKSDQTNEKLMEELIREKILFHTEQEVPHAVAVVIESMDYDKKHKQVDVSAIIIVERSSQKQILIGKNGEKIKKIGTEARLEINKLLNTKIHLNLWVKVKKDWRNKVSDLRQFGYGDD
ncbi:MAG: GTPase Era [Acholeplasmataceae bacterium]